MKLKGYIVLLLFIFSIISNISNPRAQWIHVGPANDTTFSLTSTGSIIFAGTLRGLLLSSDNGQTWLQTTLNNQNVWSLTSNDHYIFAGTWGNGLYKSSNNGQNWNVILNNYSDLYSSIAVNGLNIFAGTGLSSSNLGIYHSTNNGLNWSFYGSNEIYSLAINGNHVIVGSRWGLLYHSTDNGVTWSNGDIGFNTYIFSSLVFNGSNVFAGAAWGNSSNPSGVFISSNSGYNWVQSSLNNTGVYSIGCIWSNIFAGSDSGVYFSTNNGSSWIQKNEGMGKLTVRALLLTQNYIYAGTIENAVYRRPLSDFPIGIKPISKEIPDKFSLSQNYPNPFNPVTKIKFSLPLPSEGRVYYVKLFVYDVLGRKVASLIPPLRGGKEGFAPGTYEVEWSAGNYPSGVYFYKLIAGNFSETKKMVLVK